MSQQTKWSHLNEPDASLKNAGIEPSAKETEPQPLPAGTAVEADQNPKVRHLGNVKDAEGTGATSKKPTSEKKIASNRMNAKRSTGPKTPLGKENSSRNAIKHGIFADKLFSKTPESEAEHIEYEELYVQLKEYYQPIGFKEELLVEQIHLELVRSGRILRWEKQVLENSAALMSAAFEKVLRYNSFHSRRLSRLLEDLETEQAKRQS